MVSFRENREISNANVSPMAKRGWPGTPCFIEVSGFCKLITISLPCPVPGDLQCIGDIVHYRTCTSQMPNLFLGKYPKRFRISLRRMKINPIIRITNLNPVGISVAEFGLWPGSKNVGMEIHGS